MSDLRDFTGKNRVFTGTDAITAPSGTSAERVDGVAKLRFNTTTNLMEYYEGTDWKAIDAPPILTNFEVDGGSTVTSATVDNEGGGTVEFTINGSLFDTTGVTVQFIGVNGAQETVNTQSITRNSSSLITCTVTVADFDVSNSPYNMVVTNGSGLAATLESAVSADVDAPSFTNAENTTFSVYDGSRSSGTIAANDLCGASNATGYSVQSGSLPSGFTLNTSTGAITWSSVSAVGSDTTTTFTIRATSGEGGTTDRQFRITVKAPVVETFSSTGSFTFNVPTGVTTTQVLAIGGGGSGGTQVGGGGGAGGMVEHSSYPLTPGGSVSGNIGVGGTGYAPGEGGGANISNPGTNTTFGNITAIGGGAGGNHSGPSPQSGRPGGSGGGGGSSGGNQPGGSATQGPSGGGSGYGNNGGHGRPSWAGGGGGGAGGAGSNAPNGERGGDGGSGRANSISGSPVTYAGGGGGGSDNGNSSGGPGGGGPGTAPGGGAAGNGTDGRGSGGGGTRDNPSGAGDGGNGVVIVRY